MTPPRANAYRAKTQHMAAKISKHGDVSPLCATTPRAINLKVASWTIRPGAVTCRKCLRIMKEAGAKEQSA